MTKGNFRIPTQRVKQHGRPRARWRQKGCNSTRACRSRRCRQVGIIWARRGRRRLYQEPWRQRLDGLSDSNMTEELFDTALGRHRAGDLAEAESLYRQVVAQEPGHASALHNLGLLAQSAGRLPEASDWLQRASASNPDDATCHNNLGNVLRELGQPREALAAYRAAVRVDPDYLNAYFNLADTLMDSGEAAEAADCYRQILRLRADDQEALGGLGIALMSLGKPNDAMACFERAIMLRPNDPLAHFNIATAHREQQRPDAALASYRKALAINPGYAAAHNNVGLLLKSKGERDQSAQAFRDALRANPRHMPARLNLVSLLLEDNDPECAEAQCREALAIDPDHPDALQNLGTALVKQNRLREAVECYERVLRLMGDDIQAYLKLASALIGLRQRDNAERVLRQALDIDPEHPRVHYLLGDVQVSQERLDEAITEYRIVDSTASAYAYAQDGLGRALWKQGHPRAAIAAYARALAARPSYSESHSNSVFAHNYLADISPAALLDTHRSWARTHASHFSPGAGVARDRSAEPLHIGYVSADFCRHSVAYFIEPLIVNRDKQRFRVSCYSNVAHPDDMSARIRDAADAWRDIRHLDDEAAAKLVRDDGVDILVDLSGHTAGNRLLLFARRPAPVQVSYLGYANTTGLSQIDYRLTDVLADPLGDADALHSETLIRLTTGFLCYARPSDAPAVSEAPALTNGCVTFGSFNNVAKINAQVVAAWARILNALPGSRLLLKSRQLADQGARRRLLALFAEHRVEPLRLELQGGMLKRREHLEAYARIDIALDPFPYNGTTTTCEALWMGVPVVALAGDAHRARVGASILHHSGLGELLTQDIDAYVDKALALAADIGGLNTLRRSLRERMARSELLDAAASTRDLENAYREMWQQRLSSNPPGGRAAHDILRLHIGGTKRREGWKILNILPGPDVDFVGDCTNLEAFADASADEVYASHVLEHIGYNQELPKALAHIYRILKPGARLRISVPDLDILFRLYLNPENDRNTRWEIMRIVYGGQTDPYDYHKLGFSWDSLSWYLRQIGFRDIQRVQEFGLFDDTSSLRIGDQLISLSVEAYK